MILMDVYKRGLNPYSNGTLSDIIPSKVLLYDTVLILILMEHSLTQL